MALLLGTLALLLFSPVGFPLFFPALLLTFCISLAIALTFGTGLILLAEFGPQGGGAIGEVINAILYALLILTVLVPISALFGALTLALLVNPLLGITFAAVNPAALVCILILMYGALVTSFFVVWDET
ncbi:MAG: hypothetical protein U0176_15415 [Bacteroidia bacterium]